jgi:hypothetical protein
VAKKQVEDKIPIKQFRDSSSNWWVRDAHYYLNENNELFWAAGETDKTELREAIEAFIKRNKKFYVKRAESLLEQDEITYTKVTFGKFKNDSTQEIVMKDKRYATWLYEKTTDLAIKNELKILLKK